jgi:MFS family permease
MEQDDLGRKSLTFDMDFYEEEDTSTDIHNFAVSDDDDDDDVDDALSTNHTGSSSSSWRIPLPPTPFRRSNRSNVASERNHTSTTNLLPSRQHSFRDNDVDGRDRLATTRLLFGDLNPLESPSRQHHRRNHRQEDIKTIKGEQSYNFQRPQGLAGYLFGFMYEEAFHESFDHDDKGQDENISPPFWKNALNMALFASYALTMAATALPILLIPTISEEIFDHDDSDASSFTSRAASTALFGTACGKFLNGPVSDVYGARRTSTLYAMLLALALVGLAVSQTAASLTTACFYVEFFQSVQWPCIVVILATHYPPPHHTPQYESGIYTTSIASRFGALLGIPLFSMLLQHFHWRMVCLMGAWMAMIGSSIMYLFVADSPSKINEPQNPLHHHLLQEMAAMDMMKEPRRGLFVCSRVVHSMLLNNLLPSLRHVLLSGTFWIVALAHTGSAMVRTSERILGAYYHDTSLGYLSENQAGSLSICTSLGFIVGLGIAGRIFAQSKERQRKRLVSRLYMITIAACYVLAFLAVPRLRYAVDSPDLILFFQIVSTLAMGFGIAVMYSMIPGLVGSTFSNHKGLYFAYTDGVANGISSLVWTFVAGAVGNGNADGGGWAYGWAAVALMVVLCAILMVEFMEHFFVRTSGHYHGTYETIIFA